MAEDTPTPAQQAAQLYEKQESQAAEAMEHLVSTGGFAELLGRTAENVAAVTKLGWDAMDLVIRNLRLAGRRDVVRLAQQLGRTEDKLERVLQEVEELRDELAAKDGGDEGAASNGSTQKRSGAESRS
jgi:hypothetical protein